MPDHSRHDGDHRPMLDRTVTSLGTVCLGQHIVLAAEILAGRRVSIRVDEHTLTFFDPDGRDLLRTRRNR